MSKQIAVYTRVSSKQQSTESQKPDLERWIAANAEEGLRVKWYTDEFSGKTMDRPGWNKLQAAIDAGTVSKIVVWRLDRLGRTAKGLTALFANLTERRVNLVSLKDSLDLGTSAGRLMAHVLASVAQYETEVRAERVRAGQANARARGKRWGGSKAGVAKKVTPDKESTIHRMKKDGRPITAIAKTLHLSRPTIYEVLKHADIANLTAEADANCTS